MVAGLEEITGGELRIGGQRVNEKPSRDRDIAMVFQSYALYPHMTVADNISFGLKLRKIPKEEIKRRVDAAARRSGSRSCSTAGRRCCRAASVSASRWAGPSSATRRRS